MLKDHFLLILYVVFVIVAIAFKGEEPLFVSNGPYPYGKPLVWLVLIAFFIYSTYVNSKENFFKTMAITGRYRWTLQIGIDLYLGVALSAVVIYFDGGLMVLALWAVPLLIYANLATLLYFAMHYDSVMSLFI